MTQPTLVWFRDDLRVSDHPALHAAAQQASPVLGLFVLDEVSEGIRPLGGAAKWWLYGSLTELGERLAELGGSLILRRGAAHEILLQLAQEVNAGHVFWNRRYGGPERAVDAGVKSALRAQGVDARSFPGSLLTEPFEITNRSGNPFRVFTPFSRAISDRFAVAPPRDPLPAPEQLPRGSRASEVDTDRLREWRLRPASPDWATDFREIWNPGEEAAIERLDAFLDGPIREYHRERDRFDLDATSRLSPHLRWGELSSPQVWQALRGHTGEGAATFRTELGWREFAWHTLYHAPDLHRIPWRSEFEHFPWPPLHPTHLRAWQQGRTGIAVVDAGMRELWHTGTMHNRARMVVASFLTKHLLIHWRHGEEWFWDTLVDADAASNPFNWQWVAGSGVDAAPYFRVFNPERQADRFDPGGRYVRKWAPEYARADLEDDAGPPEPIVDLAEGRKRALAAWEQVRLAKGEANS